MPISFNLKVAVAILNMLIVYRHPSLRVAYIDTVEGTVNGRPQKVYYSVLLKGGDKLDEVWKNLLVT